MSSAAAGPSLLAAAETDAYGLNLLGCPNLERLACDSFGPGAPSFSTE